MGKFLPGHPKIPGSGRRKGQKSRAPDLGSIRGFLESQAWQPLVDLHGLMPKLTPYQQARISMELIAMAEKERSQSPQGATPPAAGEDDEAKRTATQTAAEFVAALPVKLDEPSGDAPHSGAG